MTTIYNVNVLHGYAKLGNRIDLCVFRIPRTVKQIRCIKNDALIKTLRWVVSLQWLLFSLLQKLSSLRSMILANWIISICLKAIFRNKAGVNWYFSHRNIPEKNPCAQLKLQTPNYLQNSKLSVGGNMFLFEAALRGYSKQRCVFAKAHCSPSQSSTLKLWSGTVLLWSLTALLVKAAQYSFAKQCSFIN